jgi:hypothetical protein
MKKLTIFLLLSLTLTKAFSQDLDSIRMEFNKLMKEYIDKNNGNTIRDIVRAEDDVWVKKGFWIFRHNEKVHVDAIYGPNHGKLDEAKEVQHLTDWSADQARYLKEVSVYLQKTNPGMIAYLSHAQKAELDSVPDSALSKPRKSLLKTEVLVMNQGFRTEEGIPEESAKEFAKEAFDDLLASKPHKKIIDEASSRFGTGITLVPIAPEQIVRYSETGFDGIKKEGVRIEKSDDFSKRFYTVIIVCNF